jgi:hypothetical protein
MVKNAVHDQFFMTSSIPKEKVDKKRQSVFKPEIPIWGILKNHEKTMKIESLIIVSRSWALHCVLE